MLLQTFGYVMAGVMHLLLLFSQSLTGFLFMYLFIYLFILESQSFGERASFMDGSVDQQSS